MPNAYRVIAVLFVICLILLLHHFTIQFDSEDPNTTRDYNFNRARPKGNTAFRPADGDIISIQGGLDSLEAEKAGRQNRIISMALYGTSPQYLIGALENAVLVIRDWKGWTLRIYHDNTVPEETLNQLKALKVDLVHIKRVDETIVDHTGMFWRYLPITDHNVTRFIVRDTDSRLTRRDRKSVEEWQESDDLFHLGRDHHEHDTSIMGGVWGAVGGFLTPGTIEQILTRKDAIIFNDDQKYLHDYVWPAVKDYTMSHDSYFCQKYISRTVLPYPTQRTGRTDFVGNPYRSADEYYGMTLTEECPKACRGDPQWRYC